MMRRRRISHLLRYVVGISMCAFIIFISTRITTNPAQDVLVVPVVPPEAPAPIKKAAELAEPSVLGEKRDWHDYKLIQDETWRTGPGEHGASVVIPPEEKDNKEALYRENGFNALASDKIALDRSVKDIRHAGSKDALKQKLDDYIAQNMEKVRIVRAAKREGLIRARLLGARAATGTVLIFLDSHSEANINWLPPLIEPIAENYRTAVCPFIDIIDYETFEYRAQDEGARGSFDWELFYKRLPLLPEDLKRPTEPFKNPVMAGGLFAISSQFFWELGGYDEGLDVWGGEQYELSFKIWQCGGTLVDAPCSRIGHFGVVDRILIRAKNQFWFGENYRRVAEVWMDEYAEFLYKKRPHYRNIEPGDLSKQRQLRDKLNCKPFKWFMTEIAFDQMEKYPPVEPPDYAWGEIRNVGGNLCVDTRFKGENARFTLEPCIRDDPAKGGEQSFVLTWHKDIRPKNRAVCFDASSIQDKSPVILYNCHNMKGNQLWKYDADKKSFLHPTSGKCLDCDSQRREIFMNTCDKSKLSQQWLFEHFNATLLANMK